MSCTTVEAATVLPTTPRRLPARAAFYLLASITLTFLAGSAAPTPLYALYRAEWGFLGDDAGRSSSAVYALAVLAALLIAGRLSDHVGRRPVLFAAALAQAAAMVVFAEADGLADLRSSAASSRGCLPAPRWRPSAPGCSTSTRHAARSRTRSHRCSAPASAASSPG